MQKSWEQRIQDSDFEKPDFLVQFKQQIFKGRSIRLLPGSKYSCAGVSGPLLLANIFKGQSIRSFLVANIQRLEYPIPSWQQIFICWSIRSFSYIKYIQRPEYPVLPDSKYSKVGVSSSFLVANIHMTEYPVLFLYCKG